MQKLSCRLCGLIWELSITSLVANPVLTARIEKSESSRTIRFSAQLSRGCAVQNVINYGASYLCMCLCFIRKLFKNQTNYPLFLYKMWCVWWLRINFIKSKSNLETGFKPVLFLIAGNPSFSTRWARVRTQGEGRGKIRVHAVLWKSRIGKNESRQQNLGVEKWFWESSKRERRSENITCSEQRHLGNFLKFFFLYLVNVLIRSIQNWELRCFL